MCRRINKFFAAALFFACRQADLFLELVCRLKRGDKYGWGLVEDSNPIRPDWVPGPAPVVRPWCEVPRTAGQAADLLVSLETLE